MRRCEYVDVNATFNSNDEAPTTKKTDQQSRRTAWDSIHDLSQYRKLAKRLLRQFDKSWTSFEYPRTLKVNWIQTQSNISKLSFKLNESSPNQKPLSWGSSNDPYINLATRFSQINAEKQSLPHLSCHELLTESHGDPKLATGIILIIPYNIRMCQWSPPWTFAHKFWDLPPHFMSFELSPGRWAGDHRLAECCISWQAQKRKLVRAKS